MNKNVSVQTSIQAISLNKINVILMNTGVCLEVIHHLYKLKRNAFKKNLTQKLSTQLYIFLNNKLLWHLSSMPYGKKVWK